MSTLVTDHPILTLIGVALLASPVPALLPLAWSRRATGPDSKVLAAAHAMAAGLMLGLAYLLSAAGGADAPLRVAAGSVLGIVVVYGTHRLLQLGETDRLDGGSPARRHRLVAASALHDVAEGIALGCAFALDPWLGLAAGVGLALHNLAEGMVLAEVLCRAHQTVALRMTLANFPTVVLAPVAWVVAQHAPGAFAVLLGSSVGALLYLVLVDLLPEAYERAGTASIALLVSAGVGLVVGCAGLVQ